MNPCLYCGSTHVEHRFNCYKAIRDKLPRAAPQPWVVDTKGGPNEEAFEIAVVRSDNEHGIRSYGWFDENKLLISHNGGPCRWPVTQMVWDELIGVAERVAAKLNAEKERR